MRSGKSYRCIALTAGLLGLPAQVVWGAPEPTNWANDSQLEGIVDLLDPEYQKQPINVARLPIQHAIKTVHGKGRRIVYSFEDPSCGYCRQLNKTFDEMGDLTVYTFVVTFLGPESIQKANAVWCSRDRAKAWHLVMREKALPAAANAAPDCKAPNANVMRLVGLLGINMTPTVFFVDGTRMNGIKPRAEIEARLAAVAR